VKNKSVLLRLDEADDDALTKEARARKVSKAELLRVFLHEGLAGFDHKHEDLINRVNTIDGRVAHILELAAVGAAMLSAMDVGRKADGRVSEMTEHLKQGFEISQAVLVGQQRGLFKKGGN
jgi:Ribbon-helix-helix protein, copG family